MARKPASTSTRRQQIDHQTLDDGALLRELLRGREAAWREFVRRFDPLVRHHVGGMLVIYDGMIASDDFDDMMSDFYVKLLANNMRKLRVYDPGRGRRFASWLRLLAVQTVSDEMEKRLRRAGLAAFEHVVDLDADANRGARWISRERAAGAEQPKRKRRRLLQ